MKGRTSAGKREATASRLRRKGGTILRGILPIQKKFNLNIDWNPPDMIREISRESSGWAPRRNFLPRRRTGQPLLAISAFENSARKYGAEFRYGEEVTGFIIKNNILKVS